MRIADENFPLIGLWVKTAHGTTQVFSTAYLDEKSYDTAHRFALSQLRGTGVKTVTIRAYRLESKGVTEKAYDLNILDPRDLPENKSKVEEFYLAC